MLQVNQITPNKLLENVNNNHLEGFLKEELSSLITHHSWMSKWQQLAQRFQLLKFNDMSKVEIMKLEWDTEHVQSIIEETVYKVNQYLPFNKLHITVVPTLPFPFYKDQPKSLWTNAFTNGPNTILIAIPPQPDIDFLQYLLAHELHHAIPINPIYNLSLSTFTLEEWYKMEGTAEYFSLSLYPDKRWWKNNFPVEVERRYWNKCKEYLKSTDDHIKGPLCFGSKQKGIPVFAGYSFALKLVSNYVATKQVKNIIELFSVKPSKFITCYKSNF